MAKGDMARTLLAVGDTEADDESSSNRFEDAARDADGIAHSRQPLRSQARS